MSAPARLKPVLTGVGLVSPIGVGVDAFVESLKSGRSGVGSLERFAGSAAPQDTGGEVRDFDDSVTKSVMPKKQRKFVKVMCREIELGVASALTAVTHAGVDLDALEKTRFGVEFGANLMFSPPEVLRDAAWSVTDVAGDARAFAFDRWGGEGLKVLEPLWLLKYLPNMPACHIGIAVDARGPNNSLTLGEASGLLALGEATRIMQRGKADVMIAGVTGTRLHPIKSLHAKLWDELAERDGSPATWSRPFDADRNGQVLAEGAGSVVLETPDHAAARGATVLAEVLGCGASCVIDRSGKADRGRALLNAARAALRDAGVSPADVGHVNAEGLGERDADRAEAATIRELFPGGVPVTATKSYFGNCGSGTGMLELAASVLMLREGLIPPTLNCETVDPECGLDVVTGGPRATDADLFLTLNVTRAGQAGAAVVRAVR
ncbi:MAG: beta-ketoacyl-[acyl-carrier-protein] synthase family protein [Planctomycetota bacterium]